MNLSSSAACSLPSAIEDGGDDDVYKVKRILAEGGSDDERVFLIEWEGYLLEESTWEPEDNILSDEPLEAWKEEKLRQRKGVSQPFDMDEFDRLQEEYVKRKKDIIKGKENAVGSVRR
jgi:pantothenate kinase